MYIANYTFGFFNRCCEIYFTVISCATHWMSRQTLSTMLAQHNIKRHHKYKTYGEPNG